MRETVTSGARLREARSEDLASVLALIGENGLPVAGVADAFDRFIVADHDGHVVGAAGLEVYGTDGLLRSVAVAPAWRGRGLGGALTEQIIARARTDGLGRLYLLTETASAFFPRLGFTAIPRDDVSAAVRSSAEFSELCPASSVVMVRSLSGGA